MLTRCPVNGGIGLCAAVCLAVAVDKPRLSRTANKYRAQTGDNRNITRLRKTVCRHITGDLADVRYDAEQCSPAQKFAKTTAIGTVRFEEVYQHEAPASEYVETQEIHLLACLRRVLC